MSMRCIWLLTHWNLNFITAAEESSKFLRSVQRNISRMYFLVKQRGLGIPAEFSNLAHSFHPHNLIEIQSIVRIWR